MWAPEMRLSDIAAVSSLEVGHKHALDTDDVCKPGLSGSRELSLSPFCEQESMGLRLTASAKNIGMLFAGELLCGLVFGAFTTVRSIPRLG